MAGLSKPLAESWGKSSLVNQLKTLTPLTPIIVVVDQGDVQMAVEAMHIGASYALAAPVDKQLLLSKIEAEISQQRHFYRDQLLIQQAIDLLQSLRMRNVSLESTVSKDKSEQIPIMLSQDRQLQIGELVIHTREQKVFYQKIPVDLTPSQFRIFLYLAEAKGRIVPFDEIYFHLHGTRLDRSSARTALSTHMSYLRHKLGTAGCGDYLVNVRGRGYIVENAEERSIRTTKINLDLLLEQLPIILWTTNTELFITSILGQGLVSLGVEASRVIGMNLVDFLQRQDLTPTIQAHQQAFRGKSNTYEQRIRNRILEIYVEPSFNKDDEIIGCIGLALDITERKEAEEAYQLLVDHSLQGMMIMQNGRIVFANTTMAEITGYSIEELLSFDNPFKMIYAEDQAMILE